MLTLRLQDAMLRRPSLLVLLLLPRYVLVMLMPLMLRRFHATLAADTTPL